MDGNEDGLLPPRSTPVTESELEVLVGVESEVLALWPAALSSSRCSSSCNLWRRNSKSSELGGGEKSE